VLQNLTITDCIAAAILLVKNAQAGRQASLQTVFKQTSCYAITSLVLFLLLFNVAWDLKDSADLPQQLSESFFEFRLYSCIYVFIYFFLSSLRNCIQEMLMFFFSDRLAFFISSSPNF